MVSFTHNELNLRTIAMRLVIPISDFSASIFKIKPYSERTKTTKGVCKEICNENNPFFLSFESRTTENVPISQ